MNTSRLTHTLSSPRYFPAQMPWPSGCGQTRQRSGIRQSRGCCSSAGDSPTGMWFLKTSNINSQKPHLFHSEGSSDWNVNFQGHHGRRAAAGVVSHQLRPVLRRGRQPAPRRRRQLMNNLYIKLVSSVWLGLNSFKDNCPVLAYNFGFRYFDGLVGRTSRLPILLALESWRGAPYHIDNHCSL